MDRTEHLLRLQKMLAQVKEAPESELESMADPSQFESMAFDVGERDLEVAKSGLETLAHTSNIDETTISEDEQQVLEAIILPRERPAVDIINDTFGTPPAPWAHLGSGQAKQLLERAIPSIGRIELPNHPQIPYGGTGFVVGPNLLMTNRHVAEIFATGLGQRQLFFKPGQTAGVDFSREFGDSESDEREVLIAEEVVMIHPFWDMAILKVSGLSDNHPALALSVKHPDDLRDEDVAIIGYPAQDPRNQIELQNRIFAGVFNVKRLQPGKIRETSPLRSFGKTVEALTHDASTLGGNSGSAVVSVVTGEIVALHFAGIYLKANYSVPSYDLARDNRVVDLGVNFGTPTPSPTADWKAYWDATERESETVSGGGDGGGSGNVGVVASGQSPMNPTGASATWTIPLQVTVSVGTPTISTGSAAAPAVSLTSTDNQAGDLDERLFGFPSEEILAKGYAGFSATELGGPGFSWNRALNGADASSLAYSDPPAVTRQALNEWDLAKCRTVEQSTTFCFAASTPDSILISFRGTKEISDWLTNLNMVKSTRPYGMVHRGFLNAFLSVKNQLESVIESMGLGDRKLVLTGHSLGGALATIAAAEWRSQYSISAVYTYGQPAVGNRDFRDFMNSNFDNEFFRVVNDDDIVPRVPPGYVHVGKLYHFGAKETDEVTHESIGGDVDETPSISMAEFERLQASLERAQNAGSTESVGLEGFLPSLSDHSIARYIGKILGQMDT